MTSLDLPNLKGASRLCIDTETRDPNLFSTGPSTRTGGYIVGLAVGTDDNQWYFPTDHAQGVNMDKETVYRWAKDQFKTQCPKVFANAIYDLDYLAEVDVEVNGTIYDVQIAEPLIDETARSYSLNSLAQKYLGETKTDQGLYEYCANHFGGKAERKQAGNIWRCPPDIVAEYAMGDVDLPLRVLDEQLKVIENEDLGKVFDIETRLIPMLLAMRRNGCRVDVEKARQLEAAHRNKLPELQALLNDMGNTEVNVDANATLAEAFDHMGMDYPRTVKTKAPSFTQDFLESLDHPFVKAVLEVRHLQKELNPFITNVTETYTIDDRIHCLFNQLRDGEYGTVSGRFSSSHPNLQQIPKTPSMRGLYLPEEGEDFYSLDYEQIEYRICCHYGQGPTAEEIRAMYALDPYMDFHQIVADMIGIDRKPAKAINFGLVYGMGIQKTADQLGIAYDEAKKLRKQYHRKTPFVKNLADRTQEVAEERGWVKTLLGRRRRFNTWEPRKWGDRRPALPYDQARAEYGLAIKRAFAYKALNSICQGGNADICKKAMVDIWESGVCDVLGPPLTTVHDELNFSVPRTAEGTEAITEVKRMMEQAIPLRVPVLVDVEKGPNWGELEKVKLAA